MTRSTKAAFPLLSTPWTNLKAAAGYLKVTLESALSAVTCYSSLNCFSVSFHLSFTVLPHIIPLPNSASPPSISTD